jgi:acetylornithine deacetylase/succinyl-diaminopimelate desuccinylase-like protein
MPLCTPSRRPPSPPWRRWWPPPAPSARAAFEAEINDTADDPAFAEVARPHNVNAGVVSAGDWASSVPARARMQVRAGFPRGWAPEEALARLREAVTRFIAGFFGDGGQS